MDLDRIRKDFPALQQEVHGMPLVYLDSGATALKPWVVSAALGRACDRDCANVHRGVHELSMRATEVYEGTREKVRAFLGAGSTKEVIFVRGTTEAINLVAQTWGRRNVGEGDEILLTQLEHHSNIVPWQLLAEAAGARLSVVPIDDRGAVSLDDFDRLLNERTKIVSLAHVSNALGTVLPVEEVVELAHARGVPVLVDGAQGAPHVPLDVAELGCDFYAFSGHKAYAPTGSGALYVREDRYDEMPPWQGGGDMIRTVSFEGTTFAEPPARYEAGTPDIGAVFGLGAAVDYLMALGMEAVATHEHAVFEEARRALSDVPGLRFIGTAPERASAISFVLEGVHPHDVGTILDREGIAIRTGHHCAQPVMERFGVPATSRASFGLYNGSDDIAALVRGLHTVREMFGA